MKGQLLKKIAFVFVGLLFGLAIFQLAYPPPKKKESGLKQRTFWEVQSIDTVKFSRDLAKEKRDEAEFDQVIDRQILAIAQTGASHVAIGTPYDEEFRPFLKKWVDASRKHGLLVWFRGNFSGWEGWFGFEKIGREEHLAKTKEFILTSPDLFREGDVFSSCPECENGGPGDPRKTGEVALFRKFMISERQTADEAFSKIGKSVRTNFWSMNGDVAKLVMDKQTTAKMGGVVTVDHYVASISGLDQDISEIAKLTGGKVVLGEFGAPIPDIHGNFSEEEQKEWLDEALGKLSQNPHLLGINYWTNEKSSTQLWEDGEAKPVVPILTSYYKPFYFRISVLNSAGKVVRSAKVYFDSSLVAPNFPGHFEKLVAQRVKEVRIEAENYQKTSATNPRNGQTIYVRPKSHSIWNRLLEMIP